MALPEKEADGSERRFAPRMRVLKRAKIIFNNGFSTFDCVVRNVSATGALLTLAESVHMPKEFTIKISEEAPRPARLIYRRTMFAGIRYADIPEEDSERAGSERPARSAASSVSPIEPVEQAKPLPISTSIAKIRPQMFPLAVLRNLPWQD
ncbi:hypothetical protein FP2506_06826 [Fulvimarina pelagi HTCC2506]|uniref:PilZ domain-containing protein n=1 Tax=Fulvimarina pelagi HTCC2506 TaxID=314231 RepID=Q0G731_9HYPH|nr:PilZ domain-containing protein [Fulvimarina pelagi]EAU42533.1 hypothetical protein FP2506_06826 [Fulvimarina pelagi HTCC2506]